MRNRATRIAKSIACCFAVTICFLMAMVSPVPAQQGTPMRPPGVPDLKGEQIRHSEREAMLRRSEMGTTTAKVDPKRLEAAIEKIKQDFKQIQIVRNELVRGLLANKPLDYKEIAGKVDDINKCADHLKIYLLPPDVDSKDKSEKKKVEYKSEEMKGALVELCNLIANFVDNPVLKNPGVTDVQQSTRAGSDLLNIVELSSNIKRSAERLNKISK